MAVTPHDIAERSSVSEDSLSIHDGNNYPPEEEKMPNQYSHMNIPVNVPLGNSSLGKFPVVGHSLDISLDESISVSRPVMGNNDRNLFIKSYDKDIKAGPNDDPDGFKPQVIGLSLNRGNDL